MVFQNVLCVLCCAQLGTALAAQFLPDPPKLNAKAWILVDANTGHVIVEHNADLRLPPASLAKMMTTYITSEAIAEKRLKETDLVLVSDNAWRLVVPELRALLCF